MKQRIYIITGPTAAGKTDISLSIAKKINGEIISADSMQIYKELNIGTAKIKENEMEGITHHLIDFIRVDEDYSVAKFQRQAKEIVSDIISRGKTPMLVGGTGLYINSIIYDLDFSNTKSNTSLRKELSELSNEKLYEMLKEKDPASAERIHLNDTKRLIRRLEILNSGGEETGEYNFRKVSSSYDAVMIGITMNRDKLYENINKRVDIMISNGLLEEAKVLYEKYGEKLYDLKVIGYKELIEYFKGMTDVNTAIETIKRNTRRFAKRQLTWFNREKDIKWFNKSEYDSYELFKDDVLSYIKNKEN